MYTLSVQERRDYAGPALRTFFNIAQHWQLSSNQMQILLGLSVESTFYNWKKKPEQAILSNDLLERLSYIFGIYKALQILLPDPNIADNWLSLPNSHPLFNGSKPIERLLSGKIADLYVVRQYLDSERGGWT
jgi:Antitoxin Xre-like helix-turn-helix domain/Antitoxin Xre/MbcA/ParS C-terminal toxin-binding domain